MMKLWRQDKRAYTLAAVSLATVLLVAGCGASPARSRSVAQTPAASGSPATAPPRARWPGPEALACQPPATRRPWRSLPRPSAI